MRDIGGKLSRVHKTRVLFVLRGGRLRSMCLHQRDQFAKHAKLQLELDAVHHRLQGRLQRVEADVLDKQQPDVHQDDEEVDSKQLIHDPRSPSVFLWHQPEELDSLRDVDTGDEELLSTEPGQLHALHDIVSPDDRDSADICSGEGENSGWNEEDDGINDDQPENESEKAVVLDHEMQARVQDNRLHRDHAIEPNGGNHQAHPQGRQPEELQQISNGMRYDAKGD